MFCSQSTNTVCLYRPVSLIRYCGQEEEEGSVKCLQYMTVAHCTADKSNKQSLNCTAVRQCLFCKVREVCPQHVLQYILRERSEVQTNTHEIIQTNVTWTVELIGKTQQGERWVY